MLLDDDVEAVKKSATNLSKSIKTLTLKFANIYNNSVVEELEEVLSMVFPLILDEIIKSNMEAIKFFGVNLLFCIIKSST